MRSVVAAAALVSAVFAFCGCDSLEIDAGNAEIVIPAKAVPVVRYSAKELKTFLSESLGGDVPVVSRGTPGKVHFFLGDSPEARAAGIDVSALPRDAFEIVVADGSVFIAGRDDAMRDPEMEIARGITSGQRYERATLFGVYEFLEKAVGCRFYFPGELGTIVPRSKSISVPVGRKRVVPVLRIRDPYSGSCDGTWFDDSIKAASGKAINWLRLRMGTEQIPCCHGLNNFGYLSRFGKSHPEYFALLSSGRRSTDRSMSLPGQLCMTSGIWEEIYQDVKSYLSGEKADVRGVEGVRGAKPTWGNNCVGRKYVDIMCQDGMEECHCPKCQAVYNREPEFNGYWATDIMWKRTVEVAERLIKEGVPGYVTQMAYGPYRKVPAISIPTNVLVMVAERGPWSIVRKKQLENGNREIREWAEKIGRPVWIWTYPGKHLSQKFPGIPQMTPKAVGDYYKMVLPWIFGTFMESESDKFIYNYFNYYMLSRICWDADTDVDGVIAEHHRLMFGAAAGEMAEFYRTIEDKWLNKIVGNFVDTELGPQTVPPNDATLWGEVYSARVVNELDALLDRALAKVATGSLEARRIELLRREFILSLREGAESYRKRAAEIAALVWRPSEGPLELANQFGAKKKGADAGVPPPGVYTRLYLEDRNDALVFKFVCGEPKTDALVAPVRKADDSDIWRDNCVELFLNPSGDRRTFYHFMMNSSGSLTDSKGVKVGTGFPLADYKWNSGAKASAKVGKDCWTISVEIPKSAFGEMRDRFPMEALRSRNVDKEPITYYNWSPYSILIDDVQSHGTVILK